MRETSATCTTLSARSILASLAVASLLAGVAIAETPAAPPLPGKVQLEYEPNNTFDNKSHIYVTTPRAYVTGKLEKTYLPDCEPDTYLLLFDKQNGIIDADDNSSPLGNGWASALNEIEDSDGFIDNEDGTRSLRIGLTGRADGLDGVFNGLFLNNPHQQFGEFVIEVSWRDDDGELIADPELPDGSLVANPQVYTDRFEIGAEAFYINYIVPINAMSASIVVDNTTGLLETCRDVDYLLIENLVPLCDYCFTQVGGVDENCRPTDTLVGWFDKMGELFQLSYDWDNETGYSELCFTADFNGEACLAITGEGDANFDGLRDAGPRIITPCDEREWGHGVCGCWTFAIRPVGLHGEGASPLGPDDGQSDEHEVILNAMNRGDINMDGVTNTADLGIMIGNWGWIQAP